MHPSGKRENLETVFWVIWHQTAASPGILPNLCFVLCFSSPPIIPSHWGVGGHQGVGAAGTLGLRGNAEPAEVAIEIPAHSGGAVAPQPTTTRAALSCGHRALPQPHWLGENNISL